MVDFLLNFFNAIYEYFLFLYFIFVVFMLYLVMEKV